MDRLDQYLRKLDTLADQKQQSCLKCFITIDVLRTGGGFYMMDLSVAYANATVYGNSLDDLLNNAEREEKNILIDLKLND